MQEYAQEIIDEMQTILAKRRGYIAFSEIVTALSRGLRNKLYLKTASPAKVVKQKLMPVLEENFVVRKKGTRVYILTPNEMEYFVYAWLSEDKPIILNDLVRYLRPFTKEEVISLVTEMVNAGKIRVRFEDSYKVSLFASGAGHQAVSGRVQAQKVQAFRPENYTKAKFRAAYDELHRFREFVRICDVRRSLNWPREVFDGMIRTLRDNRTIQIFRADESHMTQDDVRDCFVDENHTIQGIMIWNGR